MKGAQLKCKGKKKNTSAMTKKSDELTNPFLMVLHCLVSNLVLLLSIGSASEAIYSECSTESKSPLLELGGDNASIGIMFNVVARTNITIISMDVRFQETLVDMEYKVSVWTNQESYTDTPSGIDYSWTEIFASQIFVPSTTAGTVITLPQTRFFPIEIKTGNTQAFYVGVHDVEETPILSSNGYQAGTVAVIDKHVQIYEGVADNSPFDAANATGTDISSNGALWLGRLHYGDCAEKVQEKSLCSGFSESSLTTNTDGVKATKGIMFDVEVSANITVISFDVRLGSTALGNTDCIVTVWTKSGSHVGFEGNMSAWIPIFSSPVRLPTQAADVLALNQSLFDSVTIYEGTIQSFYVAARFIDDSPILTSDGFEVGTPFASSCILQINAGTTTDSLFAASKPAAWNGVLRYRACPSKCDSMIPEMCAGGTECNIPGIPAICPGTGERPNSIGRALVRQGYKLVLMSEERSDLTSTGVCFASDGNAFNGCYWTRYKEMCDFTGLRIESYDRSQTIVLDDNIVVICNRTRLTKQWYVFSVVYNNKLESFPVKRASERVSSKVD